MGTKQKRLLKVSAMLATLAAAVLLSYMIKGQYLLLNDEQSGQVLFMAPVGPVSEFAVSFIHSVNKSPVCEYYRIKGGQIFLEAVRYYTFGAGMPTEAVEGQTMHYDQDGAIIIGGFDRPLPRLVYNIGRVSNHTLHWQGQDIPLNTLDKPGQPILFSVIFYPRFWRALGLHPRSAVIN